jgi:hypothetical protein
LFSSTGALEALFPLHFSADRVLDEGAAAKEPEQHAADKTALRCQGTQEVEEEHGSLVFGVVLHCVGIRIVEKQDASFLPGAPHVTNVHKAALRLRRDNQSEMTAHQPFCHATVRGNYLAWSEDRKKGVLNAWDAIK